MLINDLATCQRRTVGCLANGGDVPEYLLSILLGQFGLTLDLFERINACCSKASGIFPLSKVGKYVLVLPVAHLQRRNLVQ